MSLEKLIHVSKYAGVNICLVMCVVYPELSFQQQKSFENSIKRALIFI